MSIRKISKKEIDFSKIYNNRKSAAAQDGKTVRAIEKYWGDTGDLYYDDETGMVSEDGVGLGFINVKDLLPVGSDLTDVEDSKIYDTTAENKKRESDENPISSGDSEVEDIDSTVDISDIVSDVDIAETYKDGILSSIKEKKSEESANNQLEFENVESDMEEYSFDDSQESKVDVQEVQAAEETEITEPVVEVAPEVMQESMTDVQNIQESEEVEVSEFTPEPVLEESMTEVQEVQPAQEETVEEAPVEPTPEVAPEPAPEVQEVQPANPKAEFVNTTLYKKISGNTERLDYMINFLREKGLNDMQIAGVIGNAATESGLVLEIENSSHNKGIFQFEPARYPSDWSIESQMEKMWSDYLTRTDLGGKTVSERMANVSSVEDACYKFGYYFEGCNTNESERERFSRELYDYYLDNH